MAKKATENDVIDMMTYFTSHQCNKAIDDCRICSRNSIVHRTFPQECYVRNCKKCEFDTFNMKYNKNNIVDYIEDDEKRQRYMHIVKERYEKDKSAKRKYDVQYMKDRYKNDEAFRNDKKERAKKYYLAKKEKLKNSIN
jgi:hypothetical protein